MPAEIGARLRGRLWLPKAYLAARVVPERPVRRFIVLSEGRAGSEALVTRLNSHPAILCDGEILYTKRLQPERLVLGRTRLAGIRGYRAYGFKVLTKHLLVTQRQARLADYLTRLEAKGWLIVHLRRRNRLHQAISGLRANVTQFHFEVGQAPTFEPLHVEPASLLEALQIFESAEAEAGEMLRGLEHLRLVYEDDMETDDAQQRTVLRITAGLGLEGVPTSTLQARVNPRSVRDMVDNYDTVVATLAGTPFATFLDAVEGT